LDQTHPTWSDRLIMEDLSGITVIAIEQALAAPYTSGRMAEAGARVIKIEREEGDFARHYDDFVNGESAYFVWANAGKESISLNLKEEKDADLLRNLLESADVLLQNLVPGALHRLGFDLQELHQEHPSLIICSVSGYGEDGPYRDQKAYDLLIQAESGLCSITGTGDQLTRVGVSVSDISAGMTAYQEILQALFARERDPERQGRIINVSLFQSTVDWMNVPYLQHHHGGFTPQNHGLKHPSIAPYGAFACGDNKQILISIQNEREWHRLCEIALKDPDLVKDERFSSSTRRVENRELLDARIGAAFKQFDRDTVIKKLSAAGIAYGRLSDLDDLARHPQVKFRSIEVAGSSIKLLARGAEVQGKPRKTLRIPKLGQNNEKIRREFSK
jgi:crotonobetainyl-CoA:carnitine CoA-transferase CaiB-like acyl-CoA transferase